MRETSAVANRLVIHRDEVIHGHTISFQEIQSLDDVPKKYYCLNVERRKIFQRLEKSWDNNNWDNFRFHLQLPEIVCSCTARVVVAETSVTTTDVESLILSPLCGVQAVKM